MPPADYPRYSNRPFPPYRFLPGKTPHPRRDSRGHSFGLPEPQVDPIDPQDWARSEWYRYGVDLFNARFWWEAHEVFEALWHAAGHMTEPGQFFQALIHVAGSQLKHELGQQTSATKLAQSALDRFTMVPEVYMGADVKSLTDMVRNYFPVSAEVPRIRLALTSRPQADPQ